MSDRAAEALLAAAFAKGDQGAFASLYQAFSTRVFNLVLRSVRDRGIAEDLCQEIWLKVHKEAHNLRSPDAFAVWLYRLAARTCIDWARSRHREPDSELPEDLSDDEATSEPEAATLRRSEARLAWQALAALPARQSMALYLKQLEGCDYKQIGRVLDCSESSVESLLFRARRGLARVYHDMETSQVERCSWTRHVMAAVLDGEANGLQKRGLELHLDECIHCRTEMSGLRRAAAGYAALPLAGLSKELLPAILAATSTSAPAGSTLAQLIGMLAVKVKTAMVVVAVSGAVTATVTAAAVAGVDLGPANVLGDVVESVIDSPSGAPRRPLAPSAQNPAGNSGVALPSTTPMDQPGPQTGEGIAGPEPVANGAAGAPPAAPIELPPAPGGQQPPETAPSALAPSIPPLAPPSTELPVSATVPVPNVTELLPAVVPGVTGLPAALPTLVPLPTLPVALPTVAIPLPTVVVPLPAAVPTVISALPTISVPLPTAVVPVPPVVVPPLPPILPTIPALVPTPPPAVPPLPPPAVPPLPPVIPTPALPRLP